MLKIDRIKVGISSTVSKLYFLLTITVVIAIGLSSACTPKTLTETLTQTTTDTVTRTEQTQTVTVTGTPTSTNTTTTTVTSPVLSTTTESRVISTLPLEWLDYPELPRITAEELKKLYDGNNKPVIVDTRDITSFNQEHISGALSMPYLDAVINPIKMDMAILSLPKDRLIVFY
jgi:hypothetical protein